MIWPPINYYAEKNEHFTCIVNHCQNIFLHLSNCTLVVTMKRNNTDVWSMIGVVFVIIFIQIVPFILSDAMVRIYIKIKRFSFCFCCCCFDIVCVWFIAHFIKSSLSQGQFFFCHCIFLLQLEIVNKEGISIECHYITTEDGYILRLYHIPPSLNVSNADRATAPLKPMLFMHGLQSSSLDFVFYPNSSAGK